MQEYTPRTGSRGTNRPPTTAQRRTSQYSSTQNTMDNARAGLWAWPPQSWKRRETPTPYTALASTFRAKESSLSPQPGQASQKMVSACSTRDCTGATTLSETVEHWFLEKKCLGPERSLIRQQLEYSFSCGETTKALPKRTWTPTRQSRS